MQSRNIDHPVYVDTDATLQRLCEQWSRCDMLALDTEFIRTDTFYPIGALIQVSDGEGCFLLDPLTIDDFTPFSALLADTSIVKVLHSCSEDLEVFERLFGVLPRPLIDTQIAAGLDGIGFSVGYQRMTEELLQIHVPKGETRSNWLRRPLSESQVHYAALDVAYLPEMYQRLQDSLEQKGRFGWLQEECALMVERYANAESHLNYYKKVKSAWKLSPVQLMVLQSLTQWRELSAQERDMPRGRVLKDRCCFDIARSLPGNISELSAIEEIGPKLVRHNGDMILDLVHQAQAMDAELLPKALPKPLPPETGSILKTLKAHVRHRAEQLQLAPELLAKKRDYEELLRSGSRGANYQLPASLSGWRKAVVGDELLELLAR